jgi:hypothetical protein
VTVELGDILLIIRTDGEERYEVVADMRDINLWERIGPRNTLRKLAENPSTDDYYSLAHIAIKRQRLRELPPLAEWKETTVVVPNMSAAASAGLDRFELIMVLERVMGYDGATPENVADAVLDLLEDLQKRALDPTLLGR